MTVTMREIDAARADADAAIADARQMGNRDRYYVRSYIKLMEDRVERLLRKWWAQGCKDA